MSTRMHYGYRVIATFKNRRDALAAANHARKHHAS